MSKNTLKRKWGLVFTCLLFVTIAFSQSNTVQLGENIYSEDKKDFVYNSEFTVGFLLQTDGYSIDLNIGKINSYYLTTFWNFAFGEIYHPREYKDGRDLGATPGFGRTSRGFKFGK